MLKVSGDRKLECKLYHTTHLFQHAYAWEKALWHNVQHSVTPDKAYIKHFSVMISDQTFLRRSPCDCV